MIIKYLWATRPFTFINVTLYAFALFLAVCLFTVYENRGTIYQDFVIPKIEGTHTLSAPSAKGREVLLAFMASHPEIKVLAVIDADPISNTRKLVARYYANAKVEQAVLKQIDLSRPPAALFNSDEANNKQVLSILSGKFFCAPVEAGLFGQLFTDASESLKYSCRIPLPRYENKATGWISIHLSKWPVEDYDNLEVDGVSVGLVYFNTSASK